MLIEQPYRGSLFTNQHDSLKLYRSSSIVFDMSDPGTGKTRTVLAAYLELVYGDGGKLFVFCTKTTMEIVWAMEILDFAPHLKFQLLNATTRKQGLDPSADVYIINHDGIKWLTAVPGPSASLRAIFARSMICFDESSYFKHRTSDRSKAAARIAPMFAYRCNLTGTPMANTVLDLWHQAFLLDQGKRLGWSFTKFRNSVCTPIPVFRDVVRWVDKPAAYTAVSGLLKDITLRHILEECHDIPPNKKRVINFELGPKHRAIYEQMRKQAMLFFDKSGRVIDAVNAGVLTQKLQQIASGAVYSSEEEYELINNDRYELVADLAEERAHSVVFFLWKHQKAELIKEFEKRHLEYAIIDGTVRNDSKRTQAAREFQDGKLRILLCHPQSTAHGVTLTRASATIWASPTYNYEHYEQGFRRIYRATQTQPTETIIVAANRTIDVRAAEVCLTKGKRQGDFLYLVS